MNTNKMEQSTMVAEKETDSNSMKNGVPVRHPKKKVDKKMILRVKNTNAAVPNGKIERNEVEERGELLKSVNEVSSEASEQCEDKQNPGIRQTYIDRILVDRTSTKESSMEERMEKRCIKAMVGCINEAHPPNSFDDFCVREHGKITESILRTNCARSAELRDLVLQAIKDHKIFCIFNNHWYIVRPVREELLNRGWLEVIPNRKLIPRRRLPTTEQTVDKNKSADSAMEAMLTAREAFADEITESVATIFPAKLNLDKSNKLFRKSSDESVRDVAFEFQIVPPTSEKKKNNLEIREFVNKCKNNSMLSKDHLKPNEREKQKDCKGKTRAPSVPILVRKIPESPGKSENAKNIEKLSCTLHSDRETATNGRDEGNSGNGDKMLQCPARSYTASSKAKKEDSTGKVESEEAREISKFFLNENESKIVSKIIQSLNAKIHFMWLSIKPALHLKCFNYTPEIVNKFQKTTFCTKIGLWSHLKNMQWYAPEVNFPVKSPRMYNTGEADDLEAFFQDFQMTACIGILKWLSETFFDKGVQGVQKKKGKVPIKAFEFAIKQCERYIRFRENEDLNSPDEPKVVQEEWETFLQWFYIITNEHGKMQETSNAQLMLVYTKAVEILRVMKRYWPEIEIDGRLNMWIMKPYCASCGRGIFMTNNVFYIGQHPKYIVQKYIERPFLIYNTKFDIRQWFLITKLIPLEIWMYKECYLRFCTQPFALRNLHESVHLSNNSVQRKYVNQKDPSLPEQNMWDSNTFQQYLKTIGQPNVWNDVIYPGMKDAIISIMLAAQDTFDSQRRNWFEVYGADFMVSSNLKDGPWLIEINENPALDPSTKVTSRLCPQMLRDVIKVIVDKRSNKNALTGQWELVYRQNYSPCFGKVDIGIKGKKITKNYPGNQN